jgi:hypothetical protein
MRAQRLNYLMTACENIFSQAPIDIVRYEAPLNIAVMVKIGSSDETITFLRSCIGVLEIAALRAGIGDVGEFKVQDVRKHFLGSRTFPKGKTGRSEAKDRVLKMCHMLGFKVANDNESDAVAGWHYCCALHNPRLAVATTPLFGAVDAD